LTQQFIEDKNDQTEKRKNHQDDDKEESLVLTEIAAVTRLRFNRRENDGLKNNGVNTIT
jgi:hypothetical protein